MTNIMFDLAASIETEKDFNDLTVLELVEAVRKRLDTILAENNVEAFGFCDSYDVDEDS
jgi:molecular chaperone GrpE (heat shock protein)